MKKRYQHYIGVITGEGHTKKAALEHAIAQAEIACQYSEPFYVEWKDQGVVCWRGMDGVWGYGFLKSKDGVAWKVGPSTHGYDTAEQCERAARFNLTQGQWFPGRDPLDSCIVNAEDQKEYARWCSLQDNIAKYIEEGIGAEDAIRMAQEDSR